MAGKVVMKMRDLAGADLQKMSDANQSGIVTNGKGQDASV